MAGGVRGPSDQRPTYTKNQNTTLLDVLLESLLASNRDKHSHAFNCTTRKKFSKSNRNGLVTARPTNYY